MGRPETERTARDGELELVEIDERLDQEEIDPASLHQSRLLGEDLEALVA